jgi:RNA polymerase sigma factor for flagellar operon FliA
MNTDPKAAPSISDLISDGRALVRSLALRIYRSVPVRVDLDDLIAYGELGLAEAARDFEPDRNNQFSTFAYYRIRGAIYDGLAKMTWTSRARYRRLRYERMADQVLESERDSDDGTPRDAAASGQWFSRVTESLAMVFLACDGDQENNPVQSAEDPHESVSNRFIHREASEKLRSMVERLPETERRLINYVYFDGLSLQEAGIQLGFSKSWASRLHAKILEQLASDMRRLDMHD